VKSVDRFWKQVEKTPTCWIWTGNRHAYGYGRFGKGRRLTHRVSWELANGPIPDGLQVLHKCDNPPCVRPDHLFLGKNLENNWDSINKGRRPQRPNVAITARRIFSDDEVRTIRELYERDKPAGNPLRRGPKSRPHSQAGLAKLFGVDHRTIAYIVNRKTYKHVS
jgi:hypothetical protein